MEQLRTFFHLFYNDTGIPIYLYQDEICLFAFPRQTARPDPPEQYVRILFSSAHGASFCSTDYGVYFGSVRHRKRNMVLILGPVCPIPYTAADLHKLYADYVIPANSREDFQLFLQTIPSVSLKAFCDKLAFLHYCLNQELLTAEEIRGQSKAEQDSEKVTFESISGQEGAIHNESWKIESVAMDLIRTGNLRGLKELRLNDSNYHTGTFAHCALRQLKNNIIVTTTLATRAAIEGGLDHATAYRLSDLYIRTAERLTRPDDLHALMEHITFDFARRVHDCKIPMTTDDILQRAMQYVLQNVNSHITVSDVAEYVGFSRSYFSTYFKMQLGFSLSAFILRCKLEESRRLLQFTSKSLTEISNYLCFSSQSHYQTAFKKQFGITPLQYRKNPRGHTLSDA